jgi:hypothetical protein
MYETSKTLDQGLTAFAKYFKDNHWLVMSTIDDAKLKMIFASKNNLKLQVTITENSVTKKRLVNVSAVYP